jgi:alkyl sulfatase BDS1-like metallo-beta-lactamase superfamily hydrolase
VLIGRVGVPVASPVATVTGPRQLMLALLFLKAPLAQLQAMGLRIEGDAAAVKALQDALDPLPPGFNIAEP